MDRSRFPGGQVTARKMTVRNAHPLWNRPQAFPKMVFGFAEFRQDRT